MPNVWMVRAEFGKYTDQFVAGGYVALGWLRHKGLDEATSKEEIVGLFKESDPNAKNNAVGIDAGQVERFLLRMQAGDYVLTPPSDSRWIHYGKVVDPYYYEPNSTDGCPFPHRRKVEWNMDRIRRAELSVPFQNSLKGQLTVFQVRHQEEFLHKIGERTERSTASPIDPYKVVLNQLLHLDSDDFERLVKAMMAAIGFEETAVTGKPGDGGVDVIGVLNAFNFTRTPVHVQVKRYKDKKIQASDVKRLRQSIPHNEQGAFVTTSDFARGCAEVAEEVGFPRIGLINGHRFVELLVQNWDNIEEEIRESLPLQRGLVLR